MKFFIIYANLFLILNVLVFGLPVLAALFRVLVGVEMVQGLFEAMSCQIFGGCLGSLVRTSFG